MNFNPTRLVGLILTTLGLLACGLWYFHVSSVPQDLNGIGAKVAGTICLLVLVGGVVMVIRGNRQDAGEGLASSNLNITNREDKR